MKKSVVEVRNVLCSRARSWLERHTIGRTELPLLEMTRGVGAAELTDICCVTMCVGALENLSCQPGVAPIDSQTMHTINLPLHGNHEHCELFKHYHERHLRALQTTEKFPYLFSTSSRLYFFNTLCNVPDSIYYLWKERSVLGGADSLVFNFKRLSC